MRTFLALFKKEVKTYFNTPLYFVVGAIFLILSGLFYIGIVNETMLRQGDPATVINMLFSNMSVLLLFITPIFTMRLIAEEKKQGTEEFLLTSPITHGQIVLAKFFACFIFFAFLLLITSEYVLILALFGSAPYYGPILTSTIGLLLIAASYISLGLFSSSVTKSQMTAGMLGFGLLLFLWVIDFLGRRAADPWGSIFNSLSVFQHVEPFQNGLLDLTHIFYFVGLCFLFLLFTARALKSR